MKRVIAIALALLLLPIGFGGLLANCPLAGVTTPEMLHDGVVAMNNAGIPAMFGGIVEPGGFLYYFFHFGIDTGLFPIIEVLDDKVRRTFTDSSSNAEIGAPEAELLPVSPPICLLVAASIEVTRNSIILRGPYVVRVKAIFTRISA